MKIDRLVGIIMLLLEKERVSARELADLFEVSPRTIYRDIEAIGMAGVPVRATAGTGGGIEIMPQYKLDKKVFSADELSALLTGLTNLSGLVHGKEADRALAKLRSFVPPEQARAVELKAGQILIDLNPWMGSGNVTRALELVKKSLQESKVISFSYIDGHSVRTERTAEPCQLVLKGRSWYVQAFCRVRNGFRLFRLSRMTELRLLEERFTPREYEKPVLDFEGTAERMQVTIQLRIHESILDRVLEFCSYDRVAPDGEGYYRVAYPFIERDYYYDMLLGFGDKCECLSPLHVREELRRRARSLLRLYETEGGPA